jgi:hypothetical protein
MVMYRAINPGFIHDNRCVSKQYQAGIWGIFLY